MKTSILTIHYSFDMINIRVVSLIILLLSILSSCNLINDSNNEFDDSRRIKGYYKKVERNLSKDDEKRVFENINFGISQKTYYRLVPQNLKRLGGYDFEFYPKFTHDNKLYQLSIYGETLSSHGDHSAKKYLKEIITAKYGQADSLEVDYTPLIDIENQLSVVYLKSPLFRYYWYLGDKTIWISEATERNQDIKAIENQEKKLMTYPFMSIYSESLLAEDIVHKMIEEDKNKEKDINKF